MSPSLAKDPVAVCLAGLPPARRPRAAALHRLVLDLFPDVRVDMQYRMPTYHRGEQVLAWASQKRGLAVYTCSPLRIAAFRRRHPRLSAGVGCLRFRDRDPWPIEDLAQVVRAALDPGPAILQRERTLRKRATRQRRPRPGRTPSPARTRRSAR